MKKFVGELGEITQPILITYSSNDEISIKISKSLVRIFDSFIKIIILDSASGNFEKEFLRATGKVSIAIVTCDFDSQVLKRAKEKNKIYFHGFLSREYLNEEKLQSIESFIYHLDKITIAESPSAFMKSKHKYDLYESLPICLDLRPYYHLKFEESKIDGRTYGLYLGKESKEEIAQILRQSFSALGENSENRLLIFTSQLDNDIETQVSQLLLNYPNLESRIDFFIANTIKHKIHIFRSIDWLGVTSNADIYEESFAQAETARVKLIDFANLLMRTRTQTQGLSSDVERFPITHDSDFRTIRYKYISTFLTSVPPNPTSNALTLIPSDAGFFSVFNTLVSVKAFWSGRHGFSRIDPDWSVNTVLKFWKTKKLDSYCYAGTSEGNVFQLLFHGWEAPIEQPVSKTRIFSHSPNLYADPDLTYIFADRLYRSVGFSEWRLFMNKALGELKPNKIILSEIKKIFSGLNDNDYVIGMHVRHPSHAMEQPNSEIPVASDYIKIATELIESRSNLEGRTYVFLATDQESVADEFRSVFGDKLLLFSNVTRVTKKQTKEYELLSSKDQLKVGHQVQHIAASSKDSWTSSLAIEIIRDAWGLACSNVVLHSVSNVATAVSYINPNLESIPIRKGDDLESARFRLRLAHLTSLI